jgi:glycosyltransferase involved in cell wall biosynthesis
MNSLIIPVFMNSENIPNLIKALKEMARKITNLEVVFVVDGSPDSSAILLKQLLPDSGLQAQLLILSRNFGSFSAIRTGLKAARGQRFSVMAADLQEPPELIYTFFNTLENESVDIVIGTREARSDPWGTRIASGIFWKLYSTFVVPEMPVGGVDVFGCNQLFRDHLVQMEERHSSLIALLFWMGFRKKIIYYNRLPRISGKSAWTLSKKYNYLKDSVFSFTDLPVRLLTWVGILGVLISILLGLIILLSKLSGSVIVPGYSSTILTIIFFGALNLVGLGIIGTYSWRTYENTKGRPLAICMDKFDFGNLDKINSITKKGENLNA